MYELYNGGALPLKYYLDTSPLEQLLEENFNHPVLECLNPVGELQPGHTAMLEWVFSPLEAKIYSVSPSFLVCVFSNGIMEVIVFCCGF